MGASVEITGNFTEGRAHLDKVVELYHPATAFFDRSGAPSGSARNDAGAAQPAVVVALAQARGMIRLNAAFNMCMEVEQRA